MDYRALFERTPVTQPTRTALVGVGQFGVTLLAQSRQVPDLALNLLCDPEIERVRDACMALGISGEDLMIAEERTAILKGLEAGKRVLIPDFELIDDLPLDVLVEATGNAEIGARSTAAAIENGLHVVLVTKETDAVIGPLLALRAAKAGVVISQVEGDQPSLTLGLISWARTLGLRIASAGKASEYDFVLDFELGLITADVHRVGVDSPAAMWGERPSDMRDLVALRQTLVAGVPTRTPPDLCELCLMANASGLQPDREDLHAPILRATEVPSALRGDADGGLLSGSGKLEVFNCLRRPDEISFAGGVFVVVETPDAETGRLFAQKGIPVSPDGQHAMIYNPTHLLGVEAVLSILSAHRLGMSTGSGKVDPLYDVGMRASKDLPPGTVFTETGAKHEMDGVQPVLLENAPLSNGGIYPYFMAAGRRLARPVRKGEVVRFSDVEAPVDSKLLALRHEQDSIFHYSKRRSEREAS